MTDKKRIQYKSSSILAKDTFISNDTWETGINNNVLIVSDAKGTLYRETAPLLRANGYEVWHLDFVNMKGNVGYNPLSYIRYDPVRAEYDQKDILRVCEIVIRSMSEKEPFWDVAARMYVSSVIAYVLEALPEEEHTLEYVNRVIAETGIRRYDQMMNEHELLCPNSFAVRRYREFCVMAEADKMTASVLGIAATNLSSFDFREAVDMYSRTPQVDFSAFSDRKIALFLTVSSG